MFMTQHDDSSQPKKNAFLPYVIPITTELIHSVVWVRHLNTVHTLRDYWYWWAGPASDRK